MTHTLGPIVGNCLKMAIVLVAVVLGGNCLELAIVEVVVVLIPGTAI